MGRAFTDGVSRENKVTLRTRKRSWKPLADLQGLSGRTKTIGSETVSYTHLTLPTKA